MSSREMAWQWDRARILWAIENLDRFIRLAGLDDDLAMLELAIKRCRLEPEEALTHRTARELARALMRNGRRIGEVRRVVAWRNGTEVRIEIEYGDSAVEPLFQDRRTVWLV